MIGEGDILYSSWGKEQTNVDWYRVVSRKDEQVQLQPLTDKVTETGNMCGRSMPGQPKESLTLQRDIHTSEGVESVEVKPFVFAYKWDGQPKPCSWYG